MTEQTQSSADIATRALEEAKARLSPEEFRLFVYCFNVQYIVVRMQTAEGFDPKVINLLIDGLVSPLMDHYASVVGLLEKKNELLTEARAAVLAAFSAAVVPQDKEGAPVYPGVYGLIIDRARQEGFDVPTLEQMTTAEKNVPSGFRIRWDWIQSEERFFFQQSMRRIVNGKPVSRSAMEKDPR